MKAIKAALKLLHTVIVNFFDDALTGREIEVPVKRDWRDLFDIKVDNVGEGLVIVAGIVLHLISSSIKLARLAAFLLAIVPVVVYRTGKLLALKLHAKFFTKG